MKKRTFIVILMAFGIIGVYGFPYMKGTFYNVLKAALGLSDMQLGRIWSVFGAVGVFSYLGGGYLTDRLSPRKIIVAALGLSSVLHLYVSFVPSYFVILVISGLMGLTAVFAFFSASSKVLSFLGGRNGAGGVFGLYYALEGLGNMIVNTTGNRIYIVTGSELQTFIYMVRIYAVLDIIAAIGIYISLAQIEDASLQGNKVDFSQIGHVLTKKSVWLIAMIMMCNFLLYCSITYITPYLIDVFLVSEESSITYAIIRVNLLTVFAGLIFGRMADRCGSALTIIGRAIPFNVGCILLVLINEIVFQKEVGAVVLTMIYAFVATGVKAVCIVLISELDFPMMIVGTVIGVVSFIGYSPEAFLYPIAGEILEKCENKGYLYLFIICLFAASVGTLCCRYLRKLKEEEYEKRSGRISDAAKI